MRGKVKNRKQPKPDFIYDSVRVAKFINYVMLDGKKNTARDIVYGALENIKKKEKVEDPIVVFETAIRNASPMMEVRSRRIGGANYQVPREVRTERQLAMAFSWIIGAARSGKGRPMIDRLSDEIIAASKNEGEAVKKRENTHRMAEANKAFAHFAW